MDKLELYRSIVTEILTKYSQYKPSYGQVEIEQIFDRDHDRYQLLAVGWNQQQRIYGTTIHLDILDEKILVNQAVRGSPVFARQGLSDNFLMPID
jgi:XisI protein